MNRYPLWKYLVLLAVILPGLLYAVPNLYGEDPGVQVTGVRSFKVDEIVLDRMEKALAEDGKRIAVEVIRREHVASTGGRLGILDLDGSQHAVDVLMATALTGIEALSLVG